LKFRLANIQYTECQIQKPQISFRVTFQTRHLVSEVVGIFEFLDSKMHRVVTALFYENGHATEDGTATGQNGCLRKRNERQPGMAEAYAKDNQEQ
jgi:hypothetical protein